MERKDEEMGKDLEIFSTSWSLQGTTRLNQNLYIFYYNIMTFKTTITNFYEAMELLNNLEDVEYLEGNGITESELPELRVYAQELILWAQAEVKPFIEAQLRKRQEAQIFATWLSEEIKRLSELKNSSEKKIERADKNIDYLLKLFKIEKMQTEINELSYRKSEAVVFTDEEAIPAEYKKEKVTVSVDKTEIKKALKAWTEVPGAMIETRQNLQIK